MERGRSDVNHKDAWMVNKCMDSIQVELFPGVCTLCGDLCRTALDLCDACHADLPFQSGVCRHCGISLPEAGTCGPCLGKEHAYRNVVSLFDYRPPVDALILGLKYRGKLSYARLLGQLLAENLLRREEEDLPEVIIPVPLHPRRLQERGYNQALEIARPLARKLRIPIDYRACQRHRMTAAQSTLTASERQQNVRGVFSVAPGFKKKHIAIVDDVMTTGYTAAALAQQLRNCGNPSIEVWVCARAVLAGTPSR